MAQCVTEAEKERMQISKKTYDKVYRQTPVYKASQKAYRQTEKYRAARKAYRQSPGGKAQRNASHKVYRRSPGGKAARKAYQKAYDQRPERKAARTAYQQTPECKAYQKTYQQTIQERLRSNLRRRLNHAITRGQKAGSAIRDLGCTINELKAHLEVLFQPGMTWDNWAFDGWHIDHIKPLASFNLTDRGQFKRACHFTNLQPLWAKDNLRKHDKIMSDK